MTSRIFLILGGIVLAGVCSQAQRTVYIPEGAGSAEGYFQFQNAFNDPPEIGDLIDDNVITGVSSLGSGGDFSFANRAGYIDFGSDFSSVRIKELWSAYRANSNYDGTIPFEGVWWSDTADDNRAVGTFTDLDPNDFNFGTQAASTGGNQVIWTQDFNFSTVVVPDRRYLILSTGSSGFADDRVTELAIVTTPVPESSAFGLIIGAVALSLVAIRRRVR